MAVASPPRRTFSIAAPDASGAVLTEHEWVVTEGYLRRVRTLRGLRTGPRRVTHDDNRHGENFECLDCGYQNHADYNASKNIGLQYLRRRQNADAGGAPVDVRLNRGTLNVSGKYNPPASAEA